jgi:hypothetical protein
MIYAKNSRVRQDSLHESNKEEGMSLYGLTTKFKIIERKLYPSI